MNKPIQTKDFISSIFKCIESNIYQNFVNCNELID
jgi:hypothetical protein